MNAFDEDKRRAWAGRETAYAETFAQLCAHPIGLLLDAARVGAGVRLLDVGTGTGAVAVLALTRQATVTAIDPDLGMCQRAQRAAPAASVMKCNYDRLSQTYLQPDGLLHLPTAAVVASGRVPG